MSGNQLLSTPFELPNGARLKNRLIKSAMSDMLGNGRGNPTPEQARLYALWAKGGVAASIVGEVQGDPRFPEASGNLVLNEGSDTHAFQTLAQAGAADGSMLWLQLGHAGALTPVDLGDPAGPSALDLPDLSARALSLGEIRTLPASFAQTAARAQSLGFGGVQIHAAHGFLLSQFLSPLFNQRMDAYGGRLINRMHLLIETVEAVRAAVRPDFTVALKLNASDGLSGGFETDEALEVITALKNTGLDLIDISGGTYFPGAPTSSDRSTPGPYFVEFAAAARRVTDTPLMATGGFKNRQDAVTALKTGDIDFVGLARSLVLNPATPRAWINGEDGPAFPTFDATVPGGITAWYTMAIRSWAAGVAPLRSSDPAESLRALATVKAQKDAAWREAFVDPPQR